MAAGAGAGAPEIGSKLPPFLLLGDDGRLVGLADLPRHGPLVVSFNRGHWCPYCRFELLALAEIYPRIKRFGGELVSIPPEKVAALREFRDAFDVPFRFLTDLDNGYALACGLMVSLGDAVRELYLDIGIDLPEYQGNNAWFPPIPATFVIGADGRVHDRFVDPDFSRRMAPDRILECLETAELKELRGHDT